MFPLGFTTYTRASCKQGKLLVTRPGHIRRQLVASLHRLIRHPLNQSERHACHSPSEQGNTLQALQPVTTTLQDPTHQAMQPRHAGTQPASRESPHQHTILAQESPPGSSGPHPKRSMRNRDTTMVQAGLEKQGNPTFGTSSLATKDRGSSLLTTASIKSKLSLRALSQPPSDGI